MMRLCNGSSCPYPGRPVFHAPDNGSVFGSNSAEDKTGVSRGHSRYGNEPDGRYKNAESGWSHKTEGPNTENGDTLSCSYSAVKPDGRADIWRGESQVSPEENLLEKILSYENMRKAWKQVRSNKGAPGIDGITVDAFPEHTRERWKSIKAELYKGTYTPSAVRRVEIDKPDGGKRPLGIPNVLDRLIQQGIAQVLSDIFDPLFSEYSYGFRPGRSAHQAVHQVREYIREGYTVAVDVDLTKFFDRVNHDILMERVARKVKDKRVLRLIGKYLRAGVVVNGRLQCIREGVPQGGPLSPLLANIVLDELDRELERRGHKFVRYADDFTILVKSQCSGERVLKSITKFLEKKLKLQVNEKKSQVVPTDKSSFLGFSFTGKKIRWSDKSLNEFKRRIRKYTGRSWGVSMSYRMSKLREYIRGWMGYYGISEYYRPVPELDEWLRRRIRMCYWKQWKHYRKRIGTLIKLGVAERDAIYAGLSRKSYWRLSRTMATHKAMSNKWLAEQGLISIREEWIRIHYPATAR